MLQDLLDKAQKYNKLIVALAGPAIAYANQAWGFSIPATPNQVAYGVSIVTAFLVYLVPNKKVST